MRHCASVIHGKIVGGVMNRFIVALLFVLVSIASQAWGKTYEEIFTPKANKAYTEDINVWVYTSAFAKRFGMPKQWVDDGLKGAYAAAFRVETVSGRMMFPHKGPGVSIPNRYCILDVYLPSDAKIPWVSDQVADFKSYQPNSPSYLIPQTKADWDWRARPVGLPYWGDGGVAFGTGEQRLGGFLVKEYDKELYPGVTYISFSKSCTTPPKTASWIEFIDFTPRRSSKSLWHYRTKGGAHRIDLPASFMQRVYENWYQRHRKAAVSEWGGLIKGGKAGSVK